MSHVPDGTVDRFLDHAIAGERTGAVRVTLDLLDAGVPFATILDELFREVQFEVGRRWHRGEWNTADEHLVTGVTQAALEAVAGLAPVPTPEGLVVVACAEGDWHALPSQLFAEALRTEGHRVLFLGASTPQADLRRFLTRRAPDAVAITCNLALSYTGVARVIEAAHGCGVPAIVGGRAVDERRARKLGADGWAADAASATELIRRWRVAPVTLGEAPTVLDLSALGLDAAADDIAARAMSLLEERHAGVAAYTTHQRDRTFEDLAFIVRYVAATRLVDDPTVFDEFQTWLTELLQARHVPLDAIDAGMCALADVLGDQDEAASRFLASRVSAVR